MTEDTMAQFLASVEQKAFRMAMLAVRNRDDAMDIVQDAMLKLVQRYSSHDDAEWPPLFFRILHHRITDQHRRNTWARWLYPKRNEPDDDNDIPDVADPGLLPQDQQLHQQRAMLRLQKALNGLPLRQQQAYLLRHWQGLDVKATAIAMSCSEGSVKTHLSRALATLKNELAEDWP